MASIGAGVSRYAGLEAFLSVGVPVRVCHGPMNRTMKSSESNVVVGLGEGVSHLNAFRSVRVCHFVYFASLSLVRVCHFCSVGTWYVV